MTEERKIIIRVFEQIGSEAAVSTDDGNSVFNLINRAFQGESKVVLDFQNIELVTSAFLNPAIGQLYNSYDSSFLNANLKIENLSSDDLSIVQKVIERAKAYFENKNKMDKIINKTLDDDN